MRVPDAVEYDRAKSIQLWRRTVGNGTLTCELLKADKPGARRLVQLIADYEVAGDGHLRTCICDDEDDEQRQVKRLTELMLAAQVRSVDPVGLAVELQGQVAAPGLEDEEERALPVDRPGPEHSVHGPFKLPEGAHEADDTVTPERAASPPDSDAFA